MCHTNCSRSPLPWEVSPFPVLHFSGGCPSRGFCQGGGFLGGSSLSVSVFLFLSVRLGPAVLGCRLPLTGHDDGACGRCAHTRSFGSGQVRPCLQRACGGQGSRVHAVRMSCVSLCDGAALLRAFSLGVGHRGLAYVSVLNLEGCSCCRLQDQVWLHLAERLTHVRPCLWRAAGPWGGSDPRSIAGGERRGPSCQLLVSLSCCAQGAL